MLKIFSSDQQPYLKAGVIGIHAECKERRCSSEIKIVVDKKYKGPDSPATEEKFCSGAPLTIGFSYVFFVEAPGNSVGNAGCSGVVQRDGVFSCLDNLVYRYMSRGSFE